MPMPNFETGGLSLETDAEATRRVQESTKVAEPVVEAPTDLALQAETQAAEDAEKATAIVANLKGEGAPQETQELRPADFDQASQLLSRLHAGANTAEGVIDMGYGRVSEQAKQGIKELKELLPKVDQVKLAEDYFSSTPLSGNREAYQVYLALKGTEFARRFKELENDRLQKGGYGKFEL